MWRDLSIKTKLRLVTLLTTGAALLVASITLCAFEWANFRENVTRDLTSLAEIVATASTAPVAFSNQGEAESALKSLAAKPHVRVAAIYLPDGSLFAGYTAPPVASHFPSAAGPDGIHFEGARLVLVRPIIQGEQRLGTLYLEDDYSSRVRDLWTVYGGIGVLVVAAALGLALFLGARLQRVIAAPITALAETAKAVSERHDYTVRAEASSQDELRSLIDSFNQMLERIQAQDAALRRANDDLEGRVRGRTWELQQVKNRFELILNSAGEGIYGVDASGRITFANPAAARALDWEVHQMIGRAEHSLFHHAGPDGRLHPVEPCPICGAFRDRRPREVADQQFGRKDGTLFPVEFVSTPITAVEGEAGAVVVFRDTTERRNLEFQLRQAQKMDSIGRTAAGVAHDFNNIIAIIQGYATLLKETSGSDADDLQAIKEILHATVRAASLTNQLLAFSRKQVLQRKVIDLNAVVANVTRMIHRVLGEDVQLKLSPAPELPAVYADPGMLEQVIVNLALNARDAMPNGGDLIMRTSSVMVDESRARRNPEARPGLCVCLSVQDTGCGMDAKTLSRLFEPFFTTKSAGKGTGLGLATAYGIVKQHQGWIEVSSELWKGTCFNVFLPATQLPKEAEAAMVTDLPASLNGHGTILLVEDEAPLRLLAQRVLEKCGYTVLPAGTGAEAIQVWKQQRQPIDLLLTDMVMPGGISGGDLSLQLQRLDSKLRVLYTSGYSVEATGQGLDLQAGVNFLPKPYAPVVLAQAVQRMLTDGGIGPSAADRTSTVSA